MREWSYKENFHRYITHQSGCGSDRRAVASVTTGQQFESSHWQILLLTFLLVTVEKTKINKKRPRMIDS